MRLKSEVFHDGEMIPKVFTVDGDDASPPLSWEEVPPETRSFALVVDDPDAPGRTFVHWLLYNIPAVTHSLERDIPAVARLPNGQLQGKNDFGRIGYGGPAPPKGTHRYVFKIYALDNVLELGSGENKDHLLKAMEGHILDEAQLMGKYRH